MAIPGALIYFARKRRDVPFHWLFVMFGLFIVSCGFTHLFDIWTFYDPIYRVWGLVKGFTAVVSLATVVALLPAIPKALALPGLAAVNRSLEAEIATRQEAEASLRQTQEAVARSEERLRRTIDAALDGVISMDGRGRIIGWNDQAAAIFGHARADAMGKDLAALIIPPELREGHTKGLEHFLATGVGPVLNRRIEITGLHRDGRTFPVELAITAMKVGNSFEFSAFVRDISTRKEAERSLRENSAAIQSANEALRLANQEARAANQSKSVFLANMSHEIRTPMTALLGFVDILAESSTSTAERTDAIQTIRRNGEHLLAVINDILDISKIEAGRMRMESVPCALAAIVRDATALLRQRAVDKGLAFHVESATPLPQTIRTDPIRVKQILINLLGNAIKFTHAGTVRLTVRAVTDDADHATWIEFDVADTGIGLNPDEARNLFQPFSQADTSTTRRFGGTGLGLAISKRLAQQLGGHLQLLHSVPAEGSVFRLTIDPGPLDGVTIADLPMDADDAAVPPATTPSRESPSLHGIRVLLAEDGPDNQRLIQHICRRAGIEVVVVENGQAAMECALAEQARGSPFAVILMDMQMPVMDGYSATEGLRRQGYQGPIIALTAHNMSGDRDKCLAAGCSEYASKPVDRGLLLETIRRLAAHAEPSAA